MKSLTAVCQTGASMPPMNPNGRIARQTPQRGDGENAEMKMYLSKLKDLVPFMPKNRKLSKLEIIQHVIDYICDLQTELEAHPEIGNFDAVRALNMNDDDSANDTSNNSEENERLAERLLADNSYSTAHQQNMPTSTSSPALRQPLADRQAPNTILPGTNMTAAAAHTTMALHMQQQLQLQQQQWEQQMQQQQQQTQQQPPQQQQQQPQQSPQQHHQQMPTGETVSCWSGGVLY